MSGPRLRIAHVVASAWPARGGVESLLQLCAAAQAEHHDVSITAAGVENGISLGRESQRRRFDAFVQSGVRTEHLRLGAGSCLLPSLSALDRMRGFGRVTNGRARTQIVDVYGRAYGRDLATALAEADVIHAWSTGVVGETARRAAERISAPFVITPFVHPGVWGDDSASRRLHRRADAVVGLLESDAEVLRTHGVADARLEVIGSCVPAPQPPGVDMRERHDIRGPLLLFLGVRRAYKGWDIALEAALLLAQDRPDLTLAFVGPGEPLVASDSALRVIDAGSVDEQEKSDWLRAAQVLVLPSAHEIFPLAVLEGWSAGLAAVTSDLDPLVELAKRGGGSLTTSREPTAIAAAIGRLLHDSSLATRLGAMGLEFWESEGRPEAVASRLVDVYRQLDRVEVERPASDAAGS